MCDLEEEWWDSINRQPLKPEIMSGQFKLILRRHDQIWDSMLRLSWSSVWHHYTPNPWSEWNNWILLPPLSPVLMLLLLLFLSSVASIRLTDSRARISTQQGVWEINSHHKSIRLNEEWHKKRWFITATALCQWRENCSQVYKRPEWSHMEAKSLRTNIFSLRLVLLAIETIRALHRLYWLL